LAKIGFVLSCAPLHLPGARSFYHLALAALNQGHEVFAYCHLDGVYQPLRGQHLPDAEEGSPSSWWAALLARGVRVWASELCARSRGIDNSELWLEGVRMGNSADLAELVARCDKVLCL
jgi:sulfur relay (sulfurtransferase) complex TusBCD TusD component (DsrE family)